MEELIRAAADGKTQDQPETIIAMLQARIGRLLAGPRRLVLAASVYGQSFCKAGVAAVLGRPEQDAELDGWLHVLVDCEIVESPNGSRVSEQREYRFRHALVRDAAYGLLSQSDQQLGHKLAAEFLEAGDGQAAPAILAYHFRQAGLVDRALYYYLQAGERASQQGLYEEARLHYEAADATIRLLPSSPPLRRLHVDILLKRVAYGVTLGSAASQLRLLDDSRALLELLADPEADSELNEQDNRLRLARVDYYYASIYYFSGQPARAMPFFQRVLPVALEFGDEELLGLTCQILGMAELLQGQAARAVATLAPLFRPSEPRFSTGLEAIRSLMYPAMALALNGRFREAAALAVRASALATRSKQPALQGLVLSLQSISNVLAAQWSTALRVSQEALGLCKQTGQAVQQYLALDALAYAQSQLGLHEPALRTRAEAVTLRQTLGGTLAEDWFEAGEAELLLNAGRLEEALARAKQVACASKEAGLLFSYPIAARVWGCALARLGGDPAEVDAQLTASLLVCEPTGQVSATIRTQLSWGTICRARGDEAGAQQRFALAIKLLAEGGSQEGLAWARRIAGESTVTG